MRHVVALASRFIKKSTLILFHEGEEQALRKRTLDIASGNDRWRDSRKEGQQREPTKPRVSNRLWLMMLAITVHNIPEGLAVGVAFGHGAAGRTRLESFNRAR